jgi:hypothetical protein
MEILPWDSSLIPQFDNFSFTLIFKIKILTKIQTPLLYNSNPECFSLSDMIIITQNAFFKPYDNSNLECFKNALLLKTEF